MVDPFSESELLEFVEDKLAPRRVESLRRRLAEHPGVERLVARLREDRLVLRATEEPSLPVDFVAELEPQLARAAVYFGSDLGSTRGSTPGAYRRRHRRAARRAHHVRYVAAAALLLVVLGATWAAMRVTSRLASPSVELAGDPATGPAVDRTSPTDTDAAPTDSMFALDAAGPDDDAPWPPPDTVVHHAAPLPGPSTLAVNDAEAPAPGSAPGSAPGDTAPVVGRFALVLEAPDHDTAERRLAEALASPNGALVRNYTAAEAARIVAQWHRKGMLADEPPDAISGLTGGGGDPQRRARRLAGILRRHRTQLDQEVRTSRQLVGPKRLAPSYECQLDLSGRGATHTITVRVADLADVIAQLHEPGATDLRPLAEGEETPVAPADDSPLQRWIRHHDQVRAFVDELRAEHGPDAWLLLPVVVEPAD